MAPRRSGTYWSWRAMKKRCTLSSNQDFHLYGGRGITFCDRWASFDNFLADMGERPEGTSLDRVDNEGNYEPGNCRWATGAQQGRNQRTNRLLTIGGRIAAAAQWADEVGLTHATLRARLWRGWSAEAAVFTPAQRRVRAGRRGGDEGEPVSADYYLRMASYHDAMATACRLSASAAALTPFSTPEQREQAAAAERARGERYAGMAEDYRRMAADETKRIQPAA